MEEENTPRRSTRRRSALSEISPEEAAIRTSNVSEATDVRGSTPSPDEMIIQQRGRRRKPITWSPLDYNKTNLLGPPRDKTPEPPSRQMTEARSKLRRRLIMSPVRGSQAPLGQALTKKLKALAVSRNDISTN